MKHLENYGPRQTPKKAHYRKREECYLEEIFRIRLGFDEYIDVQYCIGLYTYILFSAMAPSLVC